MDPNKGRMLKSTFFHKIRKIRKKFDINTQRVRAELILDLKALAEMAHDRAVAIKKGGRATRQHQRWARLAAYIARGINIIAREYDTAEIKAKLDEINKMVEDALREGD